MNFVIYIDAFFFVNFVLNLIILWIMQMVTGQRSAVWKLCLASMLGSISACLIVAFPNVHWLFRFIVLYVLTSGIMVYIAFSYQGMVKLIKNIVWLYLVSFFTGGVFQYLYYNMDIQRFFLDLKGKHLYDNINLKFILIASLVIIWIVLAALRSYLQVKQNRNTIFQVEVGFRGKNITGTGLLDTGNRLRDPITQRAVTLTDFQWVKSLFTTQEQKFIKEYIELVDYQAYPLKVHLIPYHSVGNSSGMLPGILVDQLIVTVNGRKKENRNIMIAISLQSLSTNGDYQAILHEECI